MSAVEGAVSVGAPSAVAIAPGASFGGVSGEIGSSGIGFDSGSPSFSGLGRSDTGKVSLPGFTEFNPSISSVPEGPVRGDIFSNMREFTPSLDSIPEGPADIEIFSSKLNPTAVEPSIFNETSPSRVEIPVNEGPVSVESLMDTVVIAKANEPEVNIENVLESIVSSQAEHADFSAETVKDAIEDLGEKDPVAAYTLRQDLAIADNIIELAHSVADPETAAKISNIAIDTAVERSGLIEIVQENAPEEQDSEANAPEVALQAPEKEAEEVQEQKIQSQKEAKYFVDEDANSARRADTAQAIQKTFEESTDLANGKVKGKDVVDHLAPEPPVEELSQLVLKNGGRNDGSESQRRNQLSIMEFETPEEALAANERLISENNAVTEQEASKRATEAEAVKVQSKIKTNLREQQVYPLAS